MKYTCHDCKFYGSHKFSDNGPCKRHSPIGFNEDDISRYGNAIWPVVFGGSWCGDFEQAPKEEIDEP